MKINAAQRLMASSDPQWFLDLSDEQQRQYLDDHPGSKLHPSAQEHKDKGQIKPHGMSKAERQKDIEFLKRQIQYARDDIAELEADGEDATKERKVLKDSLDELRDLRKG
jgi:chromosome segregation ATPase